MIQNKLKITAKAFTESNINFVIEHKKKVYNGNLTITIVWRSSRFSVGPTEDIKMILYIQNFPYTYTKITIQNL
jgi:hypothetical protein